MRQSEKDFGIITYPRKSSRHSAKRLNDLDYANDIALLETSLERAQEQLKTTSENAKKVGLEINVEKTKIMIMNTYDVISMVYGVHFGMGHISMGFILETEKHLVFKVYHIAVKSSRFSGSVHLNFTVRERNVDPVRQNKKVAR